MGAGQHDHVDRVAARLIAQAGDGTRDDGEIDGLAAQFCLGGGDEAGAAVAQHGLAGQAGAPLRRHRSRSVPSTPMTRLRDCSDAGLIAGTVPTIGRSSAARTWGRAMVEAVLQAMVISRGR